jgi:hypothetical protein
MRMRLEMVLPAVLGLCLAQPALSQGRAIRTKDAPAPLPTTPEPPPPTPVPQTTPVAPQAAPGQPALAKQATPPKVVAPPKVVPDGGPQVFKDDLTAEDLKRAQGALPDQDCQHGGCEALLRKRIGLLAFVLHVRPSLPIPGQVVELVADIAEVVEPPDPDIGDRRPLENQQVTAKVEGMGQYQVHSAGGNAGSYGFHMTPQTKGIREVELRVEGRKDPGAIFRVNIGGEQKATDKGETLELRPYQYWRGNDALGRNMYELGRAWGQLWLLSQGEGKGDLATLTKLYADLAKQGTTLPLPRRADRTQYQELAGQFSLTGELATALKPSGLRDFINNTQIQHCDRCHVAYDYRYTDDLARWPAFSVGGGDQ